MKSAPTQFPPSAQPAFRRALLRWFDAHQRPLPWRASRDPYRIWVSEIMLQQTRVTAVLEHYARFFETFPTVTSLAQAPLSKVLAVWSGLGYYRRARMLHAAARQIVHELKECFPQNAAGWQALPGIGRYTAAAIASICFGEHAPVVDGNVRRVVQRLLGHGAEFPSRHQSETLAPSEVWDFAGALLSRARPGDFNEAMMELGATVCLPRTPNCRACPVLHWCHTALPDRRLDPQVPQPRPALNRSGGRHKIERSCALLLDSGRVWLVQRALNDSVMPGMWELPSADAHPAPTGIHVCADDKPALVVRHAIMNTDYRVRVYRLRGGSVPDCGAKGNWFECSRAAQLPLTGLARKILQRAGVLAVEPRAAAAAAKRYPQGI